LIGDYAFADHVLTETPSTDTILAAKTKNKRASRFQRRLQFCGAKMKRSFEWWKDIPSLACHALNGNIQCLFRNCAKLKNFKLARNWRTRNEFWPFRHRR
jgi:hypothetical protein